MSADLVIPVLLTDVLPRWACLSELRLGDLVRFRGVPQPVVITGTERVDVHQVFTWMCVDRDGTICEGRGVHDVEQVLLIARAEQVPAADVRLGNVLLEAGYSSPYQLIAAEPRDIRPGVVDLPWRAGSLPRGLPSSVGSLQRDPSETVCRAPRGWSE